MEDETVQFLTREINDLKVTQRDYLTRDEIELKYPLRNELRLLAEAIKENSVAIKEVLVNHIAEDKETFVRVEGKLDYITEKLSDKALHRSETMKMFLLGVVSSAGLQMFLHFFKV